MWRPHCSGRHRLCTPGLSIAPGSQAGRDENLHVDSYISGSKTRKRIKDRKCLRMKGDKLKQRITEQRRYSTQTRASHVLQEARGRVAKLGQGLRHSRSLRHSLSACESAFHFPCWSDWLHHHFFHFSDSLATVHKIAPYLVLKKKRTAFSSINTLSYA